VPAADAAEGYALATECSSFSSAALGKSVLVDLWLREPTGVPVCGDDACRSLCR
jgi:hypothetical protein